MNIFCIPFVLFINCFDLSCLLANFWKIIWCDLDLLFRICVDKISCLLLHAKRTQKELILEEILTKINKLWYFNSRKKSDFFFPWNCKTFSIQTLQSSCLCFVKLDLHTLSFFIQNSTGGGGGCSYCVPFFFFFQRCLLLLLHEWSSRYAKQDYEMPLIYQIHEFFMSQLHFFKHLM